MRQKIYPWPPKTQVKISLKLRSNFWGPLLCKQLGVSEQPYDRWRKTYGGMKVGQAKRLKALETENTRLRRAVADLTVDKLILKDVAEGKY